jgi:hypothetical protein
MTHNVIIRIIHHTDGQFSVGKNPGGGHGSAVFKTREDADGCAKRLQAEAGGPDIAEITFHDLRRKVST